MLRQNFGGTRKNIMVPDVVSCEYYDWCVFQSNTRVYITRHGHAKCLPAGTVSLRHIYRPSGTCRVGMTSFLQQHESFPNHNPLRFSLSGANLELRKLL